jgi:hypothetical protein
MGILELIAGLIIGISIGSLDREPVIPNDSTRVSQAYHNIYYDVYFRGSYSDHYWNRGYYYPHTTYYVDTPRYVYVKPKKKRSGEYRRGGNKGSGNKGGSKSRGGRRATRRE